MMCLRKTFYSKDKQKYFIIEGKGLKADVI